MDKFFSNIIFFSAEESNDYSSLRQMQNSSEATMKSIKNDGY